MQLLIKLELKMQMPLLRLLLEIAVTLVLELPTLYIG